MALADRETVTDTVPAINIAAAVPQTRTKAFFAYTFILLLSVADCRQIGTIYRPITLACIALLFFIKPSMHLTIFATKKHVGNVDSDQRAVMSRAEVKLGTLIQINVRIRSCAELRKGNKVFVVGQIRQRAG